MESSLPSVRSCPCTEDGKDREVPQRSEKAGGVDPFGLPEEGVSHHRDWKDVLRVEGEGPDVHRCF